MVLLAHPIAMWSWASFRFVFESISTAKKEIRHTEGTVWARMTTEQKRLVRCNKTLQYFIFATSSTKWGSLKPLRALLGRDRKWWSDFLVKTVGVMWIGQIKEQAMLLIGGRWTFCHFHLTGQYISVVRINVSVEVPRTTSVCGNDKRDAFVCSRFRPWSYRWITSHSRNSRPDQRFLASTSLKS